MALLRRRPIKDFGSHRRKNVASRWHKGAKSSPTFASFLLVSQDGAKPRLGLIHGLGLGQHADTLHMGCTGVKCIPPNYLLSILAPREASILRDRYGLDGNEPKSLEEVGQKLRLTKERIRQIEQRALRKLRHSTIGQRLKPYLR